ncbi:unnamed protein product [Closterium sp. Yama58-4]|nr:unnamed protein product [Closterium sp. Yama58-4]
MLRPGFAAASAAGAAWASNPAEGATEGAAARGSVLKDAGTYDVARNEKWVSEEKARLLTVQGGNVPGGLLLTRGSWQWEERGPSLYRLVGRMSFHNMRRQQDIFLPTVTARVAVLLSSHSLHGISTHVSIAPHHPEGQPAPRADGYWPAYIVRAGKGTAVEVTVEIRAADSDDDAALSHLKAARLDVHYPAYGPHGSLPLVQHVILPLAFPPCPPPSAPHAPQWRSIAPGISTLAVPTHLLCHLDDPLLVLRHYAAPYLQPGDVVTLGETPLAIMQGGFRHPDSVPPGLLARLACLCFLPASSLATACGMQVLVDLVGWVRVILAVIVAILARLLLGKRGVFYQLAGYQARLIDDITCTLPPYDQFITLGPLSVHETVRGLSAKLGCGLAVVDVNDLKKVKILAATAGVDHKRLTTALLPNPAGNADQQTPIVIDGGTYDVERSERWLSEEKARLLTVQGGNVPGGLLLTRGRWQWEERGPSLYRLVGRMSFHNTKRKQDIFIPHVTARVAVLLSSHSLHGISTHVSIAPHHPEGQPAPRADGYWPAYIVRAGKGTAMEVTVEIRAADSDSGSSDAAALSHLKAARLDVHYPAYGPHGSLPLVQHVILPLAFPPCPPPSAPHAPQWRSIAPGISVLAVPTHLLCHLDDPLLVLKRAISAAGRRGDTWRDAIGHHAGRLPPSRLRASGPPCPPGLPLLPAQILSLHGLWHAGAGRLGGGGARGTGGDSGNTGEAAAGAEGCVLLQLGGYQARLIDDLTGTLPPYDQFIALGPLRPHETVRGLSAVLGCAVAVVDVNDLMKVKILAATAGVDHKRLTTALLPNPAGNADQQTPIVIEAGTYDVSSNERWLSQEKARLLTVQGGNVPGGLLLTRGSWQWEERGPSLYRLVGRMSFHNTTRKQEIFIPHVTASVQLLSSHSLRGISTHVSISPCHPEGSPVPRADGYWPAYITRAGKGTAMEVTVEIRATDSGDAAALSHLKAARLDVHYPAYGPHGSLPLVQHVILPLAFPPCPPPSAPHAPQWRSIAAGISVLAVPTHLLCHLDDPLLVLKRYAAPYLQPGDVVTLGETPLAIMQGGAMGGDTGGAMGGDTGGAMGGDTGGAMGGDTGGAMGGDTGGAMGGDTGGAMGGDTGGAMGGDTGGAMGGDTGGAMGGAVCFRHPDSVRPGPVARWACRRFLPTSSLATACGMQCLTAISIPRGMVLPHRTDYAHPCRSPFLISHLPTGVDRRVAVLLAALARVLLRRRGVFYQLAGEQARLIDDVTGTLPPYDQFITLGPLRPQETVDGLSAKLRCGVAIVDVNDLRKVQILAASAGVDHGRLTTALLPNPAGNAEEQTPIVIVRGCSKS